MPAKINQTVLMSGANHFSIDFAINAHMDSTAETDVQRAVLDHSNIKSALRGADIEVLQVDAPEDCQDGVYTANWALCHGDKAILSRLPNKRKAEEPYARKVLQKLGKKLVEVPTGLKFSGQGDALPCGDYLFVGSRYRTDQAVHQFLQDELRLNIISLQTTPQLDENGREVINAITGWPDSHFYDLDLALAVIKDDLIAWCPDAFLPESQDKIAKLPIKKIEVSLDETMNGLACNLVSTGSTVIMSGKAPLLTTQIEAFGLKTIQPDVHELQKGGGFIRCTTLTLD